MESKLDGRVERGFQTVQNRWWYLRFEANRVEACHAGDGWYASKVNLTTTVLNQAQQEVSSWSRLSSSIKPPCHLSSSIKPNGNHSRYHTRNWTSTDQSTRFNQLNSYFHWISPTSLSRGSKTSITSLQIYLQKWSTIISLISCLLKFIYLYIITYSLYELVHPMHDIRKGFYEVRKRRTSWLYLRFSIRMSVGLRMRRFSWSVKISL